MTPRALCLLLVTLVSRTATAEPDLHAGELAHALDRLGTTARVLYVAAHPDDENTRLLAYLANVRHLEVAYVSMTRGGGGQNLIGGEQGELLDVVRTEELMAARGLDRANQRFSLARDFGYSKSADETLARWGKEPTLGDVVWVIRTFQPDVIVTRFNESPPNHGHHTASAILAREAVAAAADPSKFPEQLALGAKPWKVERLLWNTYRDDPPPGTISLDVGVWDPRLGQSMGELAARSRSQHKSQGFGVAEERGPIVERFVLVAGTPPKTDLLDGVTLGWERYGAAAKPFVRAHADAVKALDRDHPERALPALLRAKQALSKLPDDPRVLHARRDLDELIAAAAGLYLRATATRPAAVPGQPLEVAVEAVARGANGLGVAQISLPESPGLTAARPLTPGKKESIPLAVSLPRDVPLSVPYWLAKPGEGRYATSDARLVGEPRDVPPVRAAIAVTLSGQTLHLERAVFYAWTDPVQGERVRPLAVLPPATVTPLRAAVMFPGNRTTKVAFRVRAAQDGLTGQLALHNAGYGWKITPLAHELKLAKAGDEVTLAFDVTPEKNATATTVTPVVRAGGAEFSLREDTIDYPHIPVQVVLRPAATKLVPLALSVPTGRIAYVRGSGDSVAEDLAHVGLAVEELDDATLRGGDLDRFAAVVLGIRAYNTRPAVRAAHERLMAYVERGGTVVVQYNTQNRLSDVGGAIGPFPLEIGRERTTDETAQPQFPDAKHPVLLGPNRLGPEDWQGWVQERGVYFAAKWDARYKPVLRFADPNEAPVEGALLVASHGKGRYVYTGLAFFRQLPAGVPGAYRLFVNLLGAK
jgi:LmbE family N-acetylglucosaminyl deacetylase